MSITCLACECVHNYDRGCTLPHITIESRVPVIHLGNADGKIRVCTSFEFDPIPDRKLWLLWIRECVHVPSYDYVKKFVIAARDEDEARRIVDREGGDEKQDGSFWCDRESANCEMLAGSCKYQESVIITREYISG